MGPGRSQYQIICAALSEQIGRGIFPAGTKLPAERQLSETFATTRVTLREALSALESDGIIYREERRGWFVSPERITYDPTINSNFHSMILGQGHIPETRLVSASLAPATAKVQQLLQLPPLEPVYHLRRLRFIDKRAALFVENFINPEYFPGLLDHALEQSLSDIYQTHYQTQYREVHFRLYPVGLHGEVASHLKVTSGSSGLLINRTNYDQKKRLIDCDFEYWRQDAIAVTTRSSNH